MAKTLEEKKEKRREYQRKYYKDHSEKWKEHNRNRMRRIRSTIQKAKK